MSSVSDYTLDNQSFANLRSELNNILAAVNTLNSATSAPASKVAGSLWLDTTSSASPTLKYYDGSDWISLCTLNHSANTVNWLDSTVSVTGLSTSATGTVATLADATITLSPSTYVRIDGGATQAGEVRLYEDTDDGSNYVGFKAPNVGTSYTLTLPTATGSANQVLATNGSSVLSWADNADQTALAIALG